MKVDKSLLEVWDWKEKVFKDSENLSLKDAAENIRKEAEILAEKYGLHLKKIQTLKS